MEKTKGMKLRDIADAAGIDICSKTLNPDVSMVNTDSRAVQSGGMFIAINGYKDSGLRYIDDAVIRGASAVVVENGVLGRVKVPGSVALCSTRSTRQCALQASRVFFEYPSNSFRLIGVTGTNGKTTVTYLLEAILKEAGCNPGVIGTISYRYNDTMVKADNTTPDPVAIQRLFSEMRDGNVTHVVMEVSSHALAMDRVLPEDFDYAVFTNLSQDHLDFHSDMEDYFRAKSKLFTGLHKDAVAVINLDDPYGRKLLNITGIERTTYGLRSDADYVAHDYLLSIDETRFFINKKMYETRLVGVHNIYNILSAAALAMAMDIEEKTVQKAIRDIETVPGRFERVGGPTGFQVFVDYAHTPDALVHLLDTALTLKKGRIITVFGCGGDRDRKKRPKMGQVVEERSDIAIVTSDNPRTEDPLAIIEDIKKGLTGDNHIIIPDRREAVYRAIELAQKNDIVLIAGKGHEDYQVLGTKKVHFDDREIAREALQRITGGGGG